MTELESEAADHELHVASSWRLCAGSRDLFTKVGSRYDLLSQCHTVVGKVDTLQPLADDRVIIDRSRNVVEQFNDQLGHVVAWCSLDITAITHSLTVSWYSTTTRCMKTQWFCTAFWSLCHQSAQKSQYNIYRGKVTGTTTNSGCYIWVNCDDDTSHRWHFCLQRNISTAN